MQRSPQRSYPNLFPKNFKAASSRRHDVVAQAIDSKYSSNQKPNWQETPKTNQNIPFVTKNTLQEARFSRWSGEDELKNI